MKARRYRTIRVIFNIPKPLLENPYGVEFMKGALIYDREDCWHVKMTTTSRKRLADILRYFRIKRKREKAKSYKQRGYRWKAEYLFVSYWGINDSSYYIEGLEKLMDRDFPKIL